MDVLRAGFGAPGCEGIGGETGTEPIGEGLRGGEVVAVGVVVGEGHDGDFVETAGVKLGIGENDDWGNVFRGIEKDEESKSGENEIREGIRFSASD